MNKHVMNFVAAIALMALAGCVNDRCALSRSARAHYLSDGEVVFGTADQATVYDLDGAAQALMARMRANPIFRGKYAALKEKCKRQPVLEVGTIVCHYSMAHATQRRLKMVRDKLAVSFYESELFALRDADLAEAVGGMGAPDCHLRGTLTRIEEDGGCYVYRLQFKLVDANAATVLWEGAETVVKVDGI